MTHTIILLAAGAVLAFAGVRVFRGIAAGVASFETVAGAWIIVLIPALLVVWATRRRRGGEAASRAPYLEELEQERDADTKTGRTGSK